MNESFARLENQKYCTNCGTPIDAKAEICPKCGVRQMAPQYYGAYPHPEHRNKVVAALLAIFLGGIGVHKFYLNRPVQGILYLLFCWTFIPALIGFVEGLIYLATRDAEFAARYG